ncbi:MAG: DUF1569 domain-containing protein [Bacteroidia bacterium]|nr:DUF1569 domain-containing protein [Bacteroidia bacterium]HQU99764.1 DUF1569 domain-containing protein [Bacteroidia bacterium]
MNEKIKYLTQTFIDQLQTLKSDDTGQWGVMKAQHMVEHMSYSVKVAHGAIPVTLVTPAAFLEKTRSFMLSDKPFKENTKNTMLPDEPLPLMFDNMQQAIEDLQLQIQLFINDFNVEGKTRLNPFFGELNFVQWLHLLDKHAKHHARQFNLL